MPMWSSVANLKESLSKIALDVHDGDDDDDDELSIYASPSLDRFDNGNSVAERRLSRNFNRRESNAHSPIVNGFDSPNNHEIEQYKKEIKRSQESEAEMKKLAVNYAALLKGKEDEILRMTEEIGSLKQNLHTANAALNSPKTVLKGSGDLSPNRQNKHSSRIRNSGSPQSNGIIPKLDGLSNGSSSDNAKELSDVLEAKNRTQEAEMKRMAMELEKEREKLANLQSQLREGQKVNGSLQLELSSLKEENDKMLKEMKRTRDELNLKISEVGRLQMELRKSDRRETDDTVHELRKAIEKLEKEKTNIKKQKDELEASLKALNSSPVHKGLSGDAHPSNSPLSSSIEGFPGNEEMQQSLQKLERDLSQSRRERDKALQELNRLKQHLLEKESEESEKMDEDSKIIEELRGINEQQRVQILRLEMALKQAIGSQEDIRKANSDEHKKAKEIIDELNRKLSNCMSTIDAKNMEVLNLQTALGQYYAEIEAKERLGEELSAAKEELMRLSAQLKEAHQQVEASKMEKDEILGKLSQAERMLVEGKNRVKKLEEDNEKLRRALEQSMTRLNRMSMDSDFLVDRRIVIKLLVTYFQRNHSKEVLDLMVRMLGFSDEDKQRIGIAQQGTGKGVVRGVLGLPGRLVGGILGGGSAGASTAMASDDQSFADLWVDFLLKETEREKKEAEDAANASNPDRQKGSPGTSSPLPNGGRSTSVSNVPRPIPFQNQNHNQNQMPFPHEHPDSEFSTVPLTSSESTTRGIRPFHRY